MKTKSIIWAVMLILSGAAGLGVVSLDILRQRRIAALHKDRCGRGAEEYVAQYLRWSELSPEERLENPWGQGDYGGPRIRRQLTREQAGRLRADIADLAAGMSVAPVVADVLYGPNWQEAVRLYRKRNDIREGIAVASTVGILVGVIIFVGQLFSWGAARLMRINRRHREKNTGESTPQSTDQPAVELPGTDQPDGRPTDGLFRTPHPDKAAPQAISTKNPSNGLTDTPFGSFQRVPLSCGGAGTAQLTETLKSQASGWAGCDSVAKPQCSGGAIATLMSTTPVGRELSELTQEVSAIREYAARQQDRVRRLQDGYDWNIIKRFCIRIIRCIDNLDERIALFAGQGHDTRSLEDVRDELVFALESSGVEQFEPEINTSYKGLEKRAEAVKTRQPTDDPDLVGKIAEIVKPGYQYVVGDDEVKIVRCSQVKLYGPADQQN